MSFYLGFDTSNYTTSSAFYDQVSDRVFSQKRLLDVRQGELGLRQSDALFAHIKRLPQIFSELVLNANSAQIYAVAASSRPRALEDSYMPCFLAGVSQGKVLAATLGVPFYEFSHQQGHIAAGAWSAGKSELLDGEFLAVHISGGTTELLHIKQGTDGLPECTCIGGTKDLAAGQLVDRCGKLLGLGFPSGTELEKLALESKSTAFSRVKMDGLDFSLSGVENQLIKMKTDGVVPADIAAFTLNTITDVLTALFTIAKKDSRYAALPILCVGGVMSNSIIRKAIEARFSAHFAEPAYSSDNAAGIALLCARAHKAGLTPTKAGVLD